MGFVGPAHAERAGDQHVALDVARPRFGQRACQREQHRPARQRPPCRAGAQTAPARIEHQRTGVQQGFDLVEAERLLAVRVMAAGRRPIERAARLGHLGEERGHARSLGRLVGDRQCRPGVGRAQRAQRQLGRGQRGHRLQRRRHRARIERGERGGGLLDAAEQQQPTHRDQARLQRVGAIGARFERGRRGGEGTWRAAEVAHGQRHLGLGHHAARARQLLVGTEARARRASTARAPADARRAAPSRCRAARAPADPRAGSRA
jgi:hypothetical protein